MRDHIDPNACILDQAAEALISAIAFYKAAGHTKYMLESGVDSFWDYVSPASPPTSGGAE
jgi:hypothetical protein